jgi:hypothetical protein
MLAGGDMTSIQKRRPWRFWIRFEEILISRLAIIDQWWQIPVPPFSAIVLPFLDGL